ncbi:site-specific integrase [Cohnella sp. AR92]|uniref:site-specific integrase n=2 Tax=Cohnella sp. AR92 TaxID=648716 RepID=UPI000F8DF7CB|nr:site-specific integrase [Cohnella sp. AR92]RUS42255.1 site-specific integrase [Cohnella sp. AR92]
MAYYRRRGCTCKKKKCTCGAKWSFTIDIGIDPKTGDRKQKTKSGFATQEEAKLEAARILLEFKNGTYIDGGDVLFKDFALTWFEKYKKSGKVKISTIQARKCGMDHLLKELSFIKLKDVVSRHIQDILDGMKDDDYSKSAIIGVHVVAKMIFDKAVEWKEVRENPVKYVTIPEFQKTVEELENEEEETRYLEKEELSHFLKTVRERGKPNDPLIFTLLAYTGLRIGELCVLKWKDIDLIARTISITKTYYNKGKTDEYLLLPPKTPKSRRTIDFDEILIDLFEAHMAKQKRLMMKYRKTYLDEGYVFVVENNKYPGYPISPHYVRGRMTRLLKRAELDETLTPHSLRHTHTSLLAEARVELPAIMERLGHEDDATTKKIYLHVTKAIKREASQRFSELMRSI